jgi:hypothetical protein
MNARQKSIALAVVTTASLLMGGATAAFASGGPAAGGGGGKSTDPTSATATGAASGKAGGCSPFVAYTPSAIAPSVYSTSPAVAVTMTLTNCAGGGTPVYTIANTVRDPSGIRPDVVQLGSYCVRGGVTYDVTFTDSQTDAGKPYVVTTVVTASNGQIVDSRTASVTTPS